MDLPVPTAAPRVRFPCVMTSLPVAKTRLRRHRGLAMKSGRCSAGRCGTSALVSRKTRQGYRAMPVVIPTPVATCSASLSQCCAWQRVQALSVTAYSQDRRWVLIRNSIALKHHHDHHDDRMRHQQPSLKQPWAATVSVSNSLSRRVGWGPPISTRVTARVPSTTSMYIAHWHTSR